MTPLLECVPNVSEGRNRAVLAALARTIRSVPGVRLLHQDAGVSTNRTVFTFAGPPAAVSEAAFALTREALARIDMRRHRGAHPRQGAVDVCPLVPLKGIPLRETARLARALGRRIGEELGIPVYLYGAAAASPARRALSYLRKGEYEGLREKLASGRLPPDYGPSRWDETVARAGATVVGARPVLIAYNVTLATEDVEAARAIAARIRESGRVERDGRGKPARRPGRLPAVAALGWYLPEYEGAQVSMNLMDWRRTGLYEAFTAVAEEAARLGLEVRDSEIVGMLPLAALVAAGQRFGGEALSEEAAVAAAVEGLRLRDFRPEERVLDYALGVRL